MDYKVNCNHRVTELESTLIKEESKLINKFVQQESKTAFNENVSAVHKQSGTPEESASVVGPLQQVKRKKLSNKKKQVKRRSTNTISQDEERISDKDISKTTPISDEGDDSSHATNFPSSNSVCDSFIERVLNEKKLALLSSPEVIQFLRTQMKETMPKASKKF